MQIIPEKTWNSIRDASVFNKSSLQYSFGIKKAHNWNLGDGAEYLTYEM